MLLFVNAGVTDDVPMKLSMHPPRDHIVSILFGEELITLDFFDVQSLERLRDLAAEGARRLHGVIEGAIEPQPPSAAV
ncbi:hypothetical protein ALI144C_50820 [Actinosynnema sp. ALI-1.44]|uniref:hypothetical protein n=1 Tax=Actinosynnema sp. ALI-1.44 TaxID=1933779 RepID=UPI00097CB31B|nr:hypothetical protein [Actinosynnema sp. ALI-1.44]ONI70885.1 hypothetical protein ALI144C_50820 [Actinosynnema sp. ALI-1.44]